MTMESSSTCIPHKVITLKDGTKLAAKIWLPSSTQSKHSTILEYLPYRKYDGTYARDSVSMKWLAAVAGIVGVRVDMEGSGDSTGVLRDEYLPSEQRQGVEVIEWIARQPWSNGKVFIYGKSWGGFNGLQIAALDATPHLAGIISLYFSHNRYQNDIHYMGGCLLTANMCWSAYMLIVQYMPPSVDYFRSFDHWKRAYLHRLRQNTGPWIHEWIAHRFEDDYWRHGSVYTQWDKLHTIPMLLYGGQLDGYIQPAFKIMDNVFDKNASSHCVIGPWEHNFPHLSMLSGKAKIHFLQQIADFVHFYGNDQREKDALKFGPQFYGFLQENVMDKQMHDQGVDLSGKWMASKRWPKNSRKYQRVELQAEYLQTEQADASKPMVVSNSLQMGKNYTTYFPMSGSEEFAEEQSFDDALSTCFMTKKIRNQDLIIFGGVKAHLVFRLNDAAQHDDNEAMVVMRLCLVTENGKGKESKLLSWKCFNLNMLNGDQQNDFRFLKADKAYRATLELPDIFQRVVADKGSYLRLNLSTSYWPMIFPSKRLVEIELLHLPEVEIPTLNAEGAGLCDAELKPYTKRKEVDSTNAIRCIRDPAIRRSYECDGKQRTDVMYSDAGCHAIEEHQWMVDEVFIDEYKIEDIDNPLSCVHTTWCKATMSKTDCSSEFRSCCIDTRSTMSCDYSLYHIASVVDVKLNQRTLFHRKWSKSFPRAATVVSRSKI